MWISKVSSLGQARHKTEMSERSFLSQNITGDLTQTDEFFRRDKTLSYHQGTFHCFQERRILVPTQTRKQQSDIEKLYLPSRVEHRHLIRR